MRKNLLMMICLFMLVGISHAQDYFYDDPDEAYQAALEAIEEARTSQTTELSLFNFGLEELPPEIGQLINLIELSLDSNQLNELPPEIGNLASLQNLSVESNELEVLPPEIGNLQSPPPEVIAQGTLAIQDYLRNQAAWHIRKMIAGAAGGVGVLAIVGLFMRWRLRSRRKDKKKR